MVPDMALLHGFQSIQSIEYTLDPLRLLKNVGSFKMSPARLEDVLDKNTTDAFVFTNSDMTSVELQRELQLLITGNNPVERVFEMHRALLRYPRSFERFTPFRLQMGLSYYETIDETLGPEYDDEHRLVTTTPNPYRGERYHPVEEALCEIISAIQFRRQDVEFFKEQRAIVLQYLEPQYEKIITGCKIVNSFVKDEQMAGGLFDVDLQPNAQFLHRCETDHLAQALLLLEDYAVSFERCMPFHIRCHFNTLKTKLDKINNAMPREKAIAHLHEAFDSDNFRYFVEDFKVACDDMDMQFIEIRTARKQIFAWDVSNDWGCGFDIDLAPNRCDDMINGTSTIRT